MSSSVPMVGETTSAARSLTNAQNAAASGDGPSSPQAASVVTATAIAAMRWRRRDLVGTAPTVPCRSSSTPSHPRPTVPSPTSPVAAGHRLAEFFTRGTHMIANIASATVRGAHGHPVTVEVHVGAGLPGFTMLGLPDEACREARDRVRAAVLSSGFDWPDRRITVNLAPPHHRKTGSGLDLAIAIGVLVAAQRIPPDAVGGLHMVGEVGLDGALHPVPESSPMSTTC
ncbi:MAG: hypothetical protein EBS20_01180 [Actinobacteria bacterium]|nr:hypothetical protein [Actinomycetota bacterium]